MATIEGWFRRATATASRRKRWTNLRSEARWGWRTLTATRRFRTRVGPDPDAGPSPHRQQAVETVTTGEDPAGEVVSHLGSCGHAQDPNREEVDTARQRPRWVRGPLTVLVRQRAGGARGWPPGAAVPPRPLSAGWRCRRLRRTWRPHHTKRNTERAERQHDADAGDGGGPHGDQPLGQLQLAVG